MLEEDRRLREERLEAEKVAAGKGTRPGALPFDTSGVGASVEAKARGSLADCLNAVVGAAEEIVRRLAPEPDPWYLSGLHVELHNDHSYVATACVLEARPAKGSQTLDEAIAFLEAFCECAERLFGEEKAVD